MMRRVYPLGAAALIALMATAWLAIPGASAASRRPHSTQNLVANGDFESPNVGSGFSRYFAGSDIDGWGVGGGSVDLVGTFWQAATGTQSLDVNGSGPGGIFQDFPTTSGATYGIGFALSGNPGCTQGVKRLGVTWNGNLRVFKFDTTGHGYNSMGWVPRGFTATATGSTTEIQFISFSKGPCGPAIDDVLVNVVG
jgi:choice-of-anchor C domain-containing protein